MIDNGLWAEMLDDRKFFYPVDLDEALTPVNTKKKIDQWRPVGEAHFVKMDSVKVYVGEHSPVIQTEETTLHGISQTGFALVADKKYSGKVVLSGEPGVRVSVSLVWGPNKSDRQTIQISSLSKDYSKYPLSFVSKGNTTKGTFEISALGKGKLYIGTASLMPEDNTLGFRTDVIKLLKGLKSGIYRWPGGNFVSGYNWKDGIGDRDKRPSRYDYAWNAVEPNDVGTDDFLMLCKLLNVEPNITVNAGFGDAPSAAEWVEYVNGSRSTPMGKLREENGHTEPYDVKWWSIGNENYAFWQLGHTALKYYVIKHNLFADAMRKVDNTIKLVAVGATPDEMTVSENAKKITGEVVAQYDSPADWSGGILRNCLKNLDIMSEHYYTQVDQVFDIQKGANVYVEAPLEEWTRRPANRIRAKVEHYHEYAKRIPALNGKPPYMYMDEWAYSNNWVHPTPTLGVTIGYARAFHEMFRNSDILKMAAFTFATSCLSFNETNVSYNTSGLLFKLYRDRLGLVPVQVNGNSPMPAPSRPIGGDQPKVNPGSPTYPLDMVATLSENGKVLTVAVVNPTESIQDLQLEFKGVKLSMPAKVWRISGPSEKARNIVDQNQEVKVLETSMTKLPKTFSVPAASINVYRFSLNK